MVKAKLILLSALASAVVSCHAAPVRFEPLTPAKAASEMLRRRIKPRTKMFEDRFHPTYPSVCDTTKTSARAASTCLHGAVMYQLFTRMFTPEGTFKAAERKLSELRELGVDIIYLTPHQLADDDPDLSFWSARQGKDWEGCRGLAPSRGDRFVFGGLSGTVPVEGR